jgi:hypothetical protein
MPNEQTAVAWWIERDGDRQFVCLDTDSGETHSFEVTDASFGGRVDR